MYLLMPVIASAAAGPEMYSTWFCAASGAICTATPDEPVPIRILTPWPIRSFASVTPVAATP